MNNCTICNKSFSGYDYEVYLSSYYRNRSYHIYFCSNECKNFFERNNQCHICRTGLSEQRSCEDSDKFIQGDDGYKYCTDTYVTNISCAQEYSESLKLENY